MRHIDVHTHLAPQILWKAFENGEDWHGMRHEVQGDLEFIAGHGKRILINSPKIRYTPEQRLADMDAEGTDVQVVSIHTPLFPYHWGDCSGDPGIAGGQRRNCRHDPAVARPLRRPRHPAGAGRRRRDCRVGKGRESPRPQGRGARHGGQRPELGRAPLPAAVQGRRGTGGAALLPPATPGQHRRGGEDAEVRPAQPAWAWSWKTPSWWQP